MGKRKLTDLQSADRPKRPVFFQTIRDRLAVWRNDYSDIEALFQAGADVPLVDTNVLAELSPQSAMRLQRTRAAYIGAVLHGGAPVPSVSIIVPVRGGAPILAECLLSIGRQTFVTERARDVQLIVIEDGIPDGARSVFLEPEVGTALETLANKGLVSRLVRLRSNQGRTQARNAGLFHAEYPLVLFVDASIVLDPDFLVEHLWRHARLKRDVALLGFKENISWSSFVNLKREIEAGVRRPDFRFDLKWHHILTPGGTDSSGFDYGGRHYKTGDGINYMQISEQFKNLSGLDAIGNRTLASFFQTNIVSVRKESVLSVGGFEPQIQGWGLEDTFLGSLLIGHGCYLIPCPSSVAFNVESEDSVEPGKFVDLELNRCKYEELMTKTRMDEYSHEKFRGVIALLDGKLEDSQPQMATSAHVGVADLNTVLGWKWNGQRLLEEITHLDYATMDALTPAHAGSPEQWLPVFFDHPDSWRVLLTEEPAVIGYWHFVALFEAEFEIAMAGRLLDESITANRIRSFEIPGVYDIYVAGFALHPVFRNSTTMLLLVTSFFDVLRTLANDRIYIGRICTNAFTSQGESLCETLMFQHVTRHVDHGEIYSIRVIDLLDQTIAARYSDLRDLYRSALSKD